LTVPYPQPGRPSLRRTQPSPPVSLEPGEYADDICDEVAAAARACIAEKGSFSLCIPGGSVVAALAQMPADAFDASKVHLFFANEKIPSYPCKEGGLDAAKKLGVCPDVWRRFPESYLRLSEITRDYRRLPELGVCPPAARGETVPTDGLALTYRRARGERARLW